MLWLRDIVWNPRKNSDSEVSAFDEFMDWVLCVNLVLVVSESVAGQYNTSLPGADYIDDVFTVVYAIEVLIKCP